MIDDELSNREIQVLSLLAQGANTVDIGIALNISRHTVKSHCLNIHRKLGVPTAAAAVAQGYEQGYLLLSQEMSI